MDLVTCIGPTWRRSARLARSLGAACLAVAAVGAGAAAQSDSARIELTGEIRVRSELDDRTSGVAADHATLLRTRLGVTAILDGRVAAFVQLSDSRAFGEEENTPTDASADRFDLHQAYIDWRPVAAVRLRAGRQELAFADERLIGPVGWANVTRSFDGARATLTRGGWTVDAFGATLAERDVVLATGLDPLTNADDNADRELYGIWAASEPLDLFAIVDRNAVEPFATDGDRYTFGGYARARVGPFAGRATVAWQTGRQTTGAGVRQSVAAYFLSGRLSYDLPEGTLQPTFAIRGDFLSGDDDPADTDFGAFNTLYATNHPFYGFMDLFLNVPAQTGGRGLMDLVASATIGPARWTLAADLHHFSLARATAGGERAVGVELDLTARRPVTPGFSVQAGYSVFTPSGAAEAPPVALGEDTLHWAYVQATVRF